MKFAVIDIETTGGLARRDKITEIAVVITDGTEIVDQFATLINPGRSIPSFITQITGITDDMVADAPFFYEIAKRLVEITENTIFVAHNVRFDYGFIKEEFRRLGYNFSKRQLCTVRLSRKIFYHLPKHNLEFLIGHFQIPVQQRHRALADALATKELLSLMLEEENSHMEIERMVNMGIRSSKLPLSITMDDIIALPEDTGIYYFKNKEGHILYIGKSKNIQKRVVGHFTRTTQKALTLQRMVHEIDFEVTGSELIALLKENEEIKRHLPEVNKAQRSTAFPYGIYRSQTVKGYTQLVVLPYSPLKNPKQGTLLRLFKSRETAKGVLASLIEAYGLCAKICGLERSKGHCFQYGIKKCNGACVEEEEVAVYNERAEEAALGISDRFERDFIIIDKGRNPEEKAIIWVQEGYCKGYGYVDDSMAISNREALIDMIDQRLLYTADVNAIVRRFIDKNKEARIIPC